MKKGIVDLMIERWKHERPELDSSSLGVLARISRLARVSEANAETVLRGFGLNDVEFQLLTEIRTASPDYKVAPRDLLRPLMVSSGGLTPRIDRLEGAGLVERLANPSDRRGVLIQLTARGRGLVDQVTTAYLANQNEVLGRALGAHERETLANLLRKLLGSMSDRGDPQSRRSMPRSKGQAPFASSGEPGVPETRF